MEALAFEICPRRSKHKRMLDTRKQFGMVTRAINVRNVVESGQAGFGLDTLIADMAVRCLGRQLSQISIHELPLRTIRQIGRQARGLAGARSVRDPVESGRAAQS